MAGQSALVSLLHRKRLTLRGGQWDEHAVLKELDSILAETPRAGLVGKLLRLKNPRKTVDLDTNLKHIQTVVRFVRRPVFVLPFEPD